MMRKELDDEEFLAALRPQDTEVTLGPTAVACLILGLLLLCGLCFGLGYSMGNRGSRTALTATPASATTATGSASKPASSSSRSSAGQSTTAPSDNPGATSAAIQPSLTASSQPSAAPATPLMVQIAVVSSHEDADVLVSALLKRGYAVSLSQDGVNGQFHVRVGPFNSLNEANSMRQKLLNDGYNAVVQP